MIPYYPLLGLDLGLELGLGLGLRLGLGSTWNVRGVWGLAPRVRIRC